jgi:acetate kinase
MRASAVATILALNSGSSSLKFGLYGAEPASMSLLLSGEADWENSAGADFQVSDAGGKRLVSEKASISTQRDAVVRIGSLLDEQHTSSLAAIGHRIVHGGVQCRNHCVVDDSVFRQLEAGVAFAPLHVPPALSVIRYTTEHFPGIPQVACLDTAFHAGLPDVARVFPLPKELRLNGIERFGFHGLSCESIIRQLSPIPERLVIAHLGNGASITAVKAGRSVDTSMGLTPTGGVIMGTRCGDIDPGVLLYLIREKQYDSAQLEDLVDRRSGLLGISGISSDMRLLHQAASHDRNARLAIQIFCYSVRKQIAAMAAVLGGIDVLVFTGGIGEHDSEVRTSIRNGLAFLGLGEILVLPSLEDEQIARHAWELTQR